MNNIKNFSFWQLIEKYQMEIPIIQRDYAQGRKDPKSTEIRNKFLDDLLECFITEMPIELDFVFGILEENSFSSIDEHYQQKTLFVPIDGQQRLTTLFLLHWYISQRANASDFSKVCFTYETRVSSRDFCIALFKNKIEFSNLIIGDNSKETLSDSIQNEFWFFRTWKHDPTVKSILHFIDVMHYKFEEKKNEINFAKAWESLKQPKNYFGKLNMQPLISFKFLDLKEFKLGEELYLKMNARGRALSDFENFKAWFIGHVELLLKDKTDIQRLKRKYFTNEYENNWQYLFDNNWTNWIWTNCFNEKLIKSTVFDRASINFIKNIAFLNYFINNNEPDIKIYEKYLQNADTIFLENIYSLCFKHIKDVTFLFDALHILSVRFKKIKHANFFPEFWENDNKKFLENIFGHTNFQQTTLLYAIIKFYEDDYERDGFEDWFRVVRNLIENSTINAENFKNILGSVVDLAISKDIAKTIVDLKGFDGEQKKEEFIKYSLVNKADLSGWKTAILDAENHPLFKGNIGFLLLDEESLLSKFQIRSKLAAKLFSLDQRLINTNNYLLIRSVLSKCDKTEVVPPLTLSNKVDNWKILLRKNLFKIAIIEILDDLTTSSDFNFTLENNCNSFTSDKVWLNALVNDTLLLTSSATGIVKDDGGIHLYRMSNWTEGNILIENKRNEIVTEFTKRGYNHNPDILFTGDIKYYRGRRIELTNEIHDGIHSYLILLKFQKDYLSVTIQNKLDETQNKIDETQYIFNEGFDKLIINLQEKYPNLFL